MARENEDERKQLIMGETGTATQADLSLRAGIISDMVDIISVSALLPY